jgi:hypothetical protein
MKTTIEHTITKINGDRRTIDLSRKRYNLTDAQETAYDDNGENDLIEDDDCDIEPSYLD